MRDVEGSPGLRRRRGGRVGREERGRQDARDGKWYQTRKASADAAAQARRATALKAAADSLRGCRRRWEPGRRSTASAATAAAAVVDPAVGAAVDEVPAAESVVERLPLDIVAEKVAAEASREETAKATAKPAAKRAGVRGQVQSIERHVFSYFFYFRRVAVVGAVAVAVAFAVAAAHAEREKQRQTALVLKAFDVVSRLALNFDDEEMAKAVSSMTLAIATTGSMNTFKLVGV